VRYFVGRESLKGIYDDILETGKEVHILGNHKRFSGFFGWYSSSSW
jgi:hypothetical protein